MFSEFVQQINQFLQLMFDIDYFHKRLQSLPTKKERKQFICAISQQQTTDIVKLWRSLLIESPLINQFGQITHIIKQILIVHTKSNYLEDITLEEVDALAHYIQKSHNFEDTAHIIDILYLEKCVETFQKSKQLFSTLVKTFEFLTTDKLREIVSQNLTQLMLQVPQFITLCNQPYYFLEYLLYIINQQQDHQKMIYWWQYIKKIYLNQQSQHSMFCENDFRVLVDILIRHIQNYSSEKDLALFLQVYLVLSIMPYLVKDHKMYKLDNIMIVLQDLPSCTQEIKQLSQQIASLSRQQH